VGLDSDRRDGVRLIQVKVGQAPYCSPAEREAMRLFEAPPTVSRSCGSAGLRASAGGGGAIDGQIPIEVILTEDEFYDACQLGDSRQRAKPGS